MDDYGKVYFAHEHSRTTTSVDPRALLQGWRMSVHGDTGLVIFENENTRQVEDPRRKLSDADLHEYFVRDWNQWWSSI
jgi:hypothetical protein